MVALSRITITVAGLALTLAGCTGTGADPSSAATATVGATATESSWKDPASAPLAGTTLVDPASAASVSEGHGAASELVATFGNGGATDAVVALAPDGSRLVIRTPAGHIDQDIIVKPSEYGWFDGTFHMLGTTADLVPGDGARQSFGEWTDGETTAWVESSSIQAEPYPWRLFAAGREGGPALITTSEEAARLSDNPWAPDPVVYDGRVYWESEAPPGTVTGLGVWSTPVIGGSPRLDLPGARGPAATDAGVFAITTLWGPEGASGLEQGAYRVARVDGDTADQTLRTLDVSANGRTSSLIGDGRWLAIKYVLSSGTGGITVFSAETGEGYSIAPLDRPISADVALCDAALVWIEPGDDWLADTIYRLDLDTGDLIAIEAPRTFRVVDCEGNDVLWSQSDANGTVKQYLTTVG